VLRLRGTEQLLEQARVRFRPDALVVGVDGLVAVVVDAAPRNRGSSSARTAGAKQKPQASQRRYSTRSPLVGSFSPRASSQFLLKSTESSGGQRLLQTGQSGSAGARACRRKGGGSHGAAWKEAASDAFASGCPVL
jgi:hypothetical protein